MVYLDNAATTFPKPECVYQEVDRVQRQLAVNVGRGGYRTASEAMGIIDSTRSRLANLVNARGADDIILGPSATIAANQVILGLDWDPYKVVYLSPFEHNSIARPVETMRAKHGFQVFILPFDSQTQELDVANMELMFAQNPPDYIFLNHVSNVTGAILPVGTIASCGKEYDAIVIMDASQSIGLVEINLSKLPVDFLIFAGHKNLYGSWGVGGFVCNSSYCLEQILSGGTGSDSLCLEMPNAIPGRFEMGSPNIIAIASLNQALKWLEEVGIDTIEQHKKRLIDRLVSGLEKTSVQLLLPGEEVPHTSVLSFIHPAYTPDEMSVILDHEYQIAVRTGYHCAPYIHELLGTVDTLGTVRISVGYLNTEQDIDSLLRAIEEI